MGAGWEVGWRERRMEKSAVQILDRKRVASGQARDKSADSTHKH